jgi:hypothetical protein
MVNPRDSEQELVDDDREQDEMSVVGIEVRPDAFSAATENEVPFVEEEGQMTAGIQQKDRPCQRDCQHRPGRGDSAFRRPVAGSWLGGS